jgi:hypothetical protein
MKYKSITTPDLEHDAANMMVELMWLNRDLTLGSFPWRGPQGREWGKSVSALKKLMKEPFGLTADQLAFYIYRCTPTEVDSTEFGKMAVVARKLLQRFDLEELRGLYAGWREERQVDGVDLAKHKKQDAKSLTALLKELEANG